MAGGRAWTDPPRRFARPFIYFTLALVVLPTAMWIYGTTPLGPGWQLGGAAIRAVLLAALSVPTQWLSCASAARHATRSWLIEDAVVRLAPSSTRRGGGRRVGWVWAQPVGAGLGATIGHVIADCGNEGNAREISAGINDSLALYCLDSREHEFETRTERAQDR